MLMTRVSETLWATHVLITAELVQDVAGREKRPPKARSHAVPRHTHTHMWTCDRARLLVGPELPAAQATQAVLLATDLRRLPRRTSRSTSGPPAHWWSSVPPTPQSAVVSGLHQCSRDRHALMSPPRAESSLRLPPRGASADVVCHHDGGATLGQTAWLLWFLWLFLTRAFTVCMSTCSAVMHTQRLATSH